MVDTDDYDREQVLGDIKPLLRNGMWPEFPLDPGWYFGPVSGPDQSVSGKYGHRHQLHLMQQVLARLGWELEADGLYGPATREATLEFQRKNELAADGLIGPDTWNAAWQALIQQGIDDL